MRCDRWGGHDPRQVGEAVRIALGIPHAKHIEGRPESLRRLIDAIVPSYPDELNGITLDFCLFSERESNRSWARKLWEWGASTDDDWLLQLQDDVIVPPFFWPALRAMLTNFPHDCIGLEAAHPAGPLLAAQGHRWYKTRAWVVGVGWVLRRTVVEELLKWDGPPELNEDDYIGAFLKMTGRDAYHPIPTIIQHDTTVPSAYMNDGHALRKATVTWENYPEASMVDPDFWRINAGSLAIDQEIPMLVSPYLDVCWFCLTPHMVNRVAVRSTHTGALVCGFCIANVVNMHMGRRPG
jgi:hypothetical protein